MCLAAVPNDTLVALPHLPGFCYFLVRTFSGDGLATNW